MNLDKVKEALEIGLNAVTNQGWTRNQDKEIYLISDAIAELEKPAEDDAFDFALRVLTFNPSTENATGRLADMIQQYAESYHAKKCAECKRDPCDTCRFYDSDMACQSCKYGNSLPNRYEPK